MHHTQFITKKGRKNMKKGKERLLVSICMIALVICIIPMNTYAKTKVPKGLYVNSLSTSNPSDLINWMLSIKNNTLTVTINDPSTQDGTSFSLSCSCLQGHADNELYQHTVTLTHNLENHKKGTYDIILFKESGKTVSDTGIISIHSTSFAKYKLSITSQMNAFYFPAGASEKTFYKSLSKYDPKKYKGVSSDIKSFKDYAKMKKLVKKITKNCKNDEEKVLAIHDWIAGNIAYDYASYYSGNTWDAADPEKVFKNKRAVCSGYARLAKIFFGIAGIPCINIIGYASGIGENDLIEGKKYNSNHEWNAVYVNGKWNILDITWDSQNKYYGKKNSNNKLNQPIEHTYYMISPEFLGADHYSMSVYTEY